MANLPGYTGYRQDRVDGRLGGGVLLFVKNSYNQWEAQLELATPNIQATGGCVRLGRRPLGVICVYRAPNSTPEEDMELIATMQEALSKFQRILIIGDFNLPEINWEEGWAPTGSSGEAFLQWLHAHALVQHVTQTTRFRDQQRPSLLDLAISRYPTDVASVELEDPLGKSDHAVFRLKLVTRHPRPTEKLVRNYGRIKVAEMVSEAATISWYPGTPNPSIEDRWDRIKTGLTALMDRFAPLMPRRSKHRPLWWKPSLDRALKSRSRLWGHYKRNRSHLAWSVYKKARNRTQALQRSAKYAYEARLAKNAKSNPKSFFAYVQSNVRVRESVGVLEKQDGSQAIDDRDKANTLLAFFKSVYRPQMNASQADTGLAGTTPSISELSVSEDEVLGELKALNKYKAAGPDGIHPAIVQPLAEILAGPITALFRESLGSAVLPGDWRKAVVVAIHKSGSRQKADNYRPVSLTSVLCKCLERLIRKQISLHLVSQQLLTPTQHGFVQRKSCLTNLLVFLDEVTRRLDEGIQVDVCYLDFSKAFDSVNHKLLEVKLQNLGVLGKAKEWIVKFLSDRTFTVRVGDHTSEPERVTSGVPQGSVLGPLLFLVFINDLARDLQNPCFMFADDVKLAGQDLERDVETVRRWSTQWDLPLNLAKCQLLTTRADAQAEGELGLQHVSEVKDLGVIISKDFKPALQCQAAASKARGVLFMICAAISCRQPNVFITLYKAIVRPHLEFCVQAWSPYYNKDITCLERVQRLATRMTAGQRGRTYEERLADLNLFSLTRRRMRGDLIETFKIVKGLSGLKFDELFEFSPSLATRGHSLKLQQHHSRLEIRAKFFTNRVVPLWNKLPEAVVSCATVIAFKSALDGCWEVVFPEVRH